MAEARRALRKRFTGYTILERVSTFSYTGRQVTSIDDDWPALYPNLKKTRENWGQLLRVLIHEGANRRISGKFYKAVVQSVLICHSETWVVIPSMLHWLDRFHRRIARRLKGGAPIYLQDEGHWVYPPMGNAMQEAACVKKCTFLIRSNELHLGR
jgi:hypothetical protein